MIKVWDLKSYHPAGHTNTDCWALLTKDTCPDTKHIAIFLAEMRPEAVADPHVHAKSDSAYFIISGRSEFTIEGETFDAGPNDCIYVPAKAKHSVVVKGTETLRAIILFGPPP